MGAFSAVSAHSVTNCYIFCYGLIPVVPSYNNVFNVKMHGISKFGFRK
jgi:hypothetical protein